MSGAGGCRHNRGLDLGEQRPQEGFILAPAAYRTLVKWLAHLYGARRSYYSLRAVKVEATRVPCEAAMGNDALGSAFQVGDEVLVMHVKDAARAAGRSCQCAISVSIVPGNSGPVRTKS